MTPPLTTSQNAVIVARLRDAEEYYRRTNELIGILGFSTAIACVSTENPTLFAMISAVFLILVWGYQTSCFKRRLRLLKDIKHPEMRFYRIYFRAWPALVGWLFLGAVTMGYFDKYGLQVNPSSHLQLRAGESQSLGVSAASTFAEQSASNNSVERDHPQAAPGVPFAAPPLRRPLASNGVDIQNNGSSR